MNRLDEIRERAEAATAGPLRVGALEGTTPEKWAQTVEEFAYISKAHGDADPQFWAVAIESPEQDGDVVTAMTGNGPTSKANAELYANAREDILYLLGEIERLREEAARIEYDEEGFCPGCGRYAKPGPDGERLGQMGWHADKCHIARVLGRQTNSMRLDEQQFKRTEDIGDAAPTALEAQP